MAAEKYIWIRDFCQGHSLEEAFLYQLQEFDLIRIVEVGSRPAIHRRELHRLERLVRLHNDLEIGPQGLQVIQHLLDRLEAMQDELWQLRRRLGRWE